MKDLDRRLENSLKDLARQAEDLRGTAAAAKDLKTKATDVAAALQQAAEAVVRLTDETAASLRAQLDAKTAADSAMQKTITDAAAAGETLRTEGREIVAEIKTAIRTLEQAPDEARRTAELLNEKTAASTASLAAAIAELQKTVKEGNEQFRKTEERAEKNTAAIEAVAKTVNEMREEIKAIPKWKLPWSGRRD